MKRYSILASTLAILLTSSLVAQYPSNLHNQDLRVWLKTNEYNGEFFDLGYNAARQQMYSFTDEVGGFIYCIYTDFQMAAEFTTFPNPINAEHIIPQSFYGDASPMRSDIHNIRPSHMDANSARSFFDFGNVPDNLATWYGISGAGNYFATGTEPSSSNSFSEGIEGLWEPKEDRKGDVARQVFYFYTMYPTQAGPITDIADINTLYQWHLNDPVDALELQRNARIEQVQGNRNPYIDHVNLVYDAWLWVEMLGCTDSNANNFDPNANTNDGSCIYGVSGCTSPEYLEFDPNATVDDGSCVTLAVYGCRYENALNYNPMANIDDFGSCIFEESVCFGDFNGDGIISATDLSTFLGTFGTACP